jgi:hypothetical protein
MAATNLETRRAPSKTLIAITCLLHSITPLYTSYQF